MSYFFNPLSKYGFQQYPNPGLSVKTTDYTLTNNDNNSIIEFNSIIPTLLNLPNNIPVGFQCFVIQIGTGVTQFQAATGASIIAPPQNSGHQKLSGQNGTLHFYVDSNSSGTNAVWRVIRGDTVAGAIAVLPAGINTITRYDFYNTANLTKSGAYVTSILGSGAYPSNLVQSNQYGVNKPISYGTLNGYTYIQGLSSSNKGAVYASNVFNFSTIVTNFTVICLAMQTHTGFIPFTGKSGCFNFFQTSPSQQTIGGISNQVGYQLGIFVGSNYANISRFIWEDSNIPHLIIYTRSGNTIYVYVDGVLQYTGTDTTTTPIYDGYCFGDSLYGGNFSGTNQIATFAALVANYAVTTADVANIDVYYQTLVPIYKSSSKMSAPSWFLFGNSFGCAVNNNGDATTAMGGFRTALSNTYSKTITGVYNISKSGISTTQIISDFPTYYKPFLQQQTGQVNVILDEAVNDIYNLQTGAQAYANYVTLKNLIIAAVPTAKVYVCVPSTFGNLNTWGVATANQAAVTQAYTDICNAIKTNAISNGFTAIIDLTIDPATGTASNLTNANNTTYFQANGNLHQTPAGYIERGRLFAVYLNSYV